MEKIIKNKITYWTDRGAIYSIDPPTAHFNLTEWSMEVPPFRPDNFLIIGCAGNTVAKLTRIIHGDVPMVGVDPLPSEPVEGMRMIQQSGLEFLRACEETFDCVLLDAFEGATLPRELREEEFADLVARVCRRVLIFHTAGEDISFYEKHFKTFHQKDIGNTRIFYMQKRDCDEEFRTPRDL